MDFIKRLENLYEAANNVWTFTTLIVMVISISSVFLKNRIKKYNKKRIVTKILSIKGNCCNIELPIREGVVNENKIDTRQNPNIETYINANEIATCIALQNMINDVKKHYRFFIKGVNEFAERNEAINIYIGGPLANKTVSRIFESDNDAPANIVDNLKGRLSIGLPKWQYDKADREAYSEKSVVYSSDDNSNENVKTDLCIRYGYGRRNEIRFHNDEGNGYCVICKINRKSFGDTVHKTAIIIFGYSSEDTIRAVDCFDKYYKEIYRKLKSNHHIDQYCIWIPIENSNIKLCSLKDITDEMFSGMSE